MTCDEFRRSVHDQMDNRSSHIVSVDQQEHVAACPACRALLASLTALDDSLRRLPRVDLPPNLMHAIHGVTLTVPTHQTLGWGPDLRRAAILLIPLLLSLAVPFITLVTVQWIIEVLVVLLGFTLFCIELLKPLVLGRGALPATQTVP